MDSEKLLSIPNLEGRKVPSYSNVKSIFFNDLDLIVSGRSTAPSMGGFNSWNPAIRPIEDGYSS